VPARLSLALDGTRVQDEEASRLSTLTKRLRRRAGDVGSAANTGSNGLEYRLASATRGSLQPVAVATGARFSTFQSLHDAAAILAGLLIQGRRFDPARPITESSSTAAFLSPAQAARGASVATGWQTRVADRPFVRRRLVSCAMLLRSHYISPVRF
jgi:hypothetical protein